MNVRTPQALPYLIMFYEQYNNIRSRCFLLNKGVDNIDLAEYKCSVSSTLINIPSFSPPLSDCDGLEPIHCQPEKVHIDELKTLAYRYIDFLRDSDKTIKKQ